MDEKELVRRILDGETMMFSLLLERHQRPVHSLVRQIINCREDAEELTQDVFLKAFNNLSKFRGDCTLSTWLYRIAYNTAISAARKKKMYFPDIDEGYINNIPDAFADELLEKTEDEEKLRNLEKAIDMLDIEDRTLISLFYSQEKSIKEIAEIMQINADNVKVKLYRTRKKLVFLTDGKNEQ